MTGKAWTSSARGAQGNANAPSAEPTAAAMADGAIAVSNFPARQNASVAEPEPNVLASLFVATDATGSRPANA